eukprot:2533382-Amphidinium_carterae.2
MRLRDIPSVREVSELHPQAREAGPKGFSGRTLMDAEAEQVVNDTPLSRTCIRTFPSSTMTTFKDMFISPASIEPWDLRA